MEQKIKEFIKEIKKNPKIDGVMLYGSYLTSKKYNDIDLCIFINSSRKEMFNLRKKLLGNAPDNFDIQIFNLLPLYVKVQVLKGKLIYSKNFSKVYNSAIQTIKDYKFFEKRYLDCISKEAII